MNGVDLDEIKKDMKVELVTEDSMTPEMKDKLFNSKPSVDAIPDLNVLTGHVYDIVEYLELPETKKILKKDDSIVMKYLNNKYADSVPLGIIKLLMEENERQNTIEILANMFQALLDAKNGKTTIEDVEMKIFEKDGLNSINHKYVYSKNGGSKEEFEKLLSKEIMKDKASKNIGNLKNLGKLTVKY